jgi:hypothetical protein
VSQPFEILIVTNIRTIGVSPLMLMSSSLKGTEKIQLRNSYLTA